ncbi:hypothetical protein ARMGADRAFT_290856 [Armillaria gallica]|uniref:NACHT domain-containing protein n=1 Tax=Armillaria gallica TaxID=47427 RepID=A0A2H3D651_ARMGA|nr:hypothetical protein ARMGADRAFT_290856 [Armillaria gallica]
MGLRTFYRQHFSSPDGSNTAHAQLRRAAFEGLKVTFRILHTVLDGCPVPGVKAFLGICCDTMSMLEAGVVNRHDSQELDPLIYDIHNRFSGLLQRYSDIPDDLRDRVKIIVCRTEEFHPELQKILEKGTLRRAFTASDNRALIARYLKRVKDALDMAMTEAALHAAMDTSFLVNNSLLSTLECVHDASWDMALECHECTEGTRSEILYNLSFWLDDISQPQIFWINGMAGTGKTALAKSVARIASDRKVLGGSFFCSKRSADRRDVRRIIPSFAFHLAAVNEEYCRQVLKVIRKWKLGFVRMPPSEQWEKLIVEPLQASGSMGSLSPILIIVDGLDECDNLDKDLWDPLWNQILKSLSDLPRVKVLVTSRPNDPTCVHSPLRNVSVLDLHTFHCESDIQLFVRRRLSNLGGSHPPQWPSNEHISWIAKESDHLFVYAAEICRYVESPGSPEQQLRKLLDNGTGLLVGMVRFYGRILTSALRFLDDEKVEECQAILGMLMLQKDPTLSLNDLSILLEHDVSHVRGLLAGFHSVLIIPVSDYEPINVFHPSFITFIASHNPWKGVCDVDGCERTRCSDHPLLRFPQFYLDTKQYNLKITMTLLRFMIPNLSSQGDDHYITSRTRRPCHRPSGPLEYACTHWADHLERSSSDKQQEVRALADMLARFLKERGKDWLDVISSYQLFLQSRHIIEKADTWRRSHSSTLSSSTDEYIKQQLNILRSSIIISSGLPGAVPDEDNPPARQSPVTHPDIAPKENPDEGLDDWPCWLRPPIPLCVKMPEPDFQAVPGPWLSSDLSAAWEESIPGISRMPARFPLGS